MLRQWYPNITMPTGMPKKSNLDLSPSGLLGFRELRKLQVFLLKDMNGNHGNCRQNLKVGQKETVIQLNQSLRLLLQRRPLYKMK